MERTGALNVVTSAFDFQEKGWVYLPYRFEARALSSLAPLGLHMGRGQRLTNMSALADKLPLGFKIDIAELGFNPTPLRAVGFNKSKEMNWSLPWHQDRIIAMAEKISHPDYKNWSRKSGIWHCEPKPAILGQMAFAYIAFDNIEDGMGGLELAEGTHKFGSIPEGEIETQLKTAVKIRPDMKIGEVILVSALTLHRSAPMTTIGKRRSLRLDFARPALNLSK